MATIGETLVAALQARGVDVVFGIPGVHTVELYRGLAASSIRHVTPRHEQGAGFMADGYARASGKPGVAFVITGPGVTNILTPMAQARADSIPMLVISSVNKTAALGKGLGHLHELPDQAALMATVALTSTRITQASELLPAIDAAFALLHSARGGPVHIEIPTDVLGSAFDLPLTPPQDAPDGAVAGLDGLIAALEAARTPVIIAGGGARAAGDDLRVLAERLDAPVVQTTNARGLMYGHPLGVPASPSLPAVRALVADADLVLALGTELGPTDFDMYQDGGMPELAAMARVDVCADQLAKHPCATPVCGRVDAVLPRLVAGCTKRQATDGAARADVARRAAYAGLAPDMTAHIAVLEAIRDAIPSARFVGDSTQAVYAGNLYYDHDTPAGWFNAATGFGALGLAIPAAIGAALGDPSTRVICITGDGGAQFTLPEIMVAVDEKLPVTFVVYNNQGYGEIETSMADAGVAIVGCDPTPPDFAHVAAACAIPYLTCALDPKAVAAALQAVDPSGPSLVEIVF